MARKRSSGKRRRPASRRGRRSHGTANSLLWWGVVGLCVVIIVGVLAGSQMLLSSNKIDADTLCHEGGPVDVTTILLDLTDPLSPTQQVRLRTIVDNEIAASGTDTMIALGVVSEFPDRWGAMFAKCKPETGEQANTLYENPRLIETQYEEEFLNPVKEEIESTLSGESESQSPIMEALQSLIVNTPNFSSVPGKRKIIIVSDMLQHSDNLSFYRGQDWEYFASHNGEGRLAGNLSDAVVKIIRIPRVGGNTPPNKLVEGFWTRYFDRQGSRPPHVGSLGDL